MPLEPGSVLLSGRVAVVTGAAQGIGRAIAEAFAAFGATVAACDRQADGLATLDVPVKEVLDVRDGDAVARFVAGLDRVDVLVNNAGGTLPRAALQTSERFFETALRFNVTTAFLLSRLVVPKMVETAGGGAIVNISSRSSDMVQQSFVAYGAAKAALNMMTRNLAAEVCWAGAMRAMPALLTSTSARP